MTQLQKVMKEFNFTFHKMDDNHYDYYEFVLPNCFYIVFIDKKDDKIQFSGITGETVFYTEKFKSVKSLRNRLCEAI